VSAEGVLPGVDVLAPGEAGEDLWATVADTLGSDAEQMAGVGLERGADIRERGIRVNAVALGVVKTPEHDPASYDGMAGLHPIGRIGEILHIDGGQAAGH
jgi:hypothetical protein